jgi:uncharacterized protein (TIGR04255 family)
VTISAARPDHLPDFRKPPLSEVVLGVQFNRVAGYQHICAAEIWNLFRRDYPLVQEQPALPPSFETFGLPFQVTQPPFMLMSGPIRSRYWFKRSDETEIIQFQEDRLLHNWKKIDAASNEYPRYESMASRFTTEFEAVQSYFKDHWKQGLEVSQCEISYVNRIVVESGEYPVASDWLRFVSFSTCPEDFFCGFREVLNDESGAPVARLVGEAACAVQDGRKILQYSLSVRGAPKSNSIEAALQFMSMGRDKIVTRFAESTTDAAHKVWERIK